MSAALARIRAALPADARAIARVYIETWRAAYPGMLPDKVLLDMTPARQEACRRLPRTIPTPSRWRRRRRRPSWSRRQHKRQKKRNLDNTEGLTKNTKIYIPLVG